MSGGSSRDPSFERQGPVVAAVHFTPAFGEVDANRAALLRLADDAAARAQAVVLPELATTGFRLSPAQAAAWAEPLDGPTVAGLSGVARARRAVVVVGLALRAPDGALENAQVVLDATGEVAGVYAKHHLYAEDHGWARAGATPGAAVETAIGRVGLLICHDLVYPRTVLAVVSRRPRLLALSTAWIADPALPEPLPLHWGLAARLLEEAPLVVANRGGAEGGVVFGDPSAVLSYRHGGVVGTRSEGPYVLEQALP